MKNLNPNKIKRYIILYADDYDCGVWEDYCNVLGISKSETEVRINCNDNDIIPGSEM